MRVHRSHALIGLGVLLAALAAFFVLRGRAPEVRYVTATVDRGDVHDVVGATGTLQAVTTVQVGTQVSGQVSQLYPNEDHGFLLTHEGTQLYFHRNSLVQRDFDELQVGDRVHFVQITGDTGPIASKVWRVEGTPG